jgi:hypothetical protein
MFDTYYLFKKIETRKTKYLLNSHSAVYNPLNNHNKHGEINITYSDFCYIKGHSEIRKTDYSVSQCSKHISSVYFPNIDFPNFAFGDYENDGLLFIIKGDKIEILVFIDKKPFREMLFNMLCNGDFDECLESFRKSE